MELTDILYEIKCSINNNKYLRLSYSNMQKRNSVLWCYIISAFPGSKKINIASYKNNTTTNLTLYLDKILDATCVNQTYHAYGDEKKSLLLMFDSIHSLTSSQTSRLAQIFSYYEEALLLEHQIFIENVIEILHLDASSFTKENRFTVQLKKSVCNKIIDELEFHYINKRNGLFNYIITDLALRKSNKLYFVAYYDLCLDLENGLLTRGQTLRFNNVLFAKVGENFYLKDYLLCSKEEFISNYEKNRDKYVQMLSVKKDFVIDSSPHIAKLKAGYIAYLADDFNFLKNNAINSNSMIQTLTNKRTFKKSFLPVYSFEASYPNQFLALTRIFNNYRSYIQGPPGTGKTSTILSAIFTAIINHQKLLITANNNKPLDDIINSIKNKFSLPFGVIRLGNAGKIEAALNEIKTIYALGRKKVIIDDEYLMEIKTRAIEETKNAINENPPSGEVQIFSHDDKKFVSLITSLFYQSFNLLWGEEYNDLREILEAYNESVTYNSFSVKAFKTYLKTKLSKFLSLFPVVISTNLSTAILGNPEPSFDYLIIDEASQCNVPSTLLTIARGKSVTLIGDLKQLQPIINNDYYFSDSLLQKYKIKATYSYINSILYLFSTIDSEAPFTLLDNHFRSPKLLIDYNNQTFYHSLIKIRNTSTSSRYEFCDITNFVKTKNISLPEATYIARDIIEHNYRPEEVGITTPFISQVKTINSVLEKANLKSYLVGTIHKLQGAEKRVIYISLAINEATTKSTAKWIENFSEIINVSTSRSTDAEIVVGNRKILSNIITSGSFPFLTSFYEYLINNATLTQTTLEDTPASNDKIPSYEQTFIKLVTLAVSEKKIEILAHPILNKINDNFPLRTHVDVALTDGIKYLLFELDGQEHYQTSLTINRDFEKEKIIISQENMKLMRIKNEDRLDFRRIKRVIEEYFCPQIKNNVE